MKKIVLTNGDCTLVDDSDYERLNQFNWYYHDRRKDGGGYVVRRQWNFDTKEARMVTMHREILGCPEGQHVDHKNGNTLDNRKSNLRICTRSQNQMNRPAQRNNTSGFKGVWAIKGTDKWQAMITVDRKRTYLGVFKDKLEAAKAYNKMAKKLHGKFAKLNKIL